jgi:effector-binding domain-containing protein
MEYQVTIETVAAQLIAASRQRTTFKLVSQEIRELLGRVWAFLGQRPDLRTDGHNVAIYWADGGDGSVEVGVQVVARFEETDEVICSATPAGTVARTAHLGPYDQLGAAHAAVRAWCRQHGHQVDGPFWEIYGDWEDDPAKLRTDVLYLVR